MTVKWTDNNKDKMRTTRKCFTLVNTDPKMYTHYTS